MAIRLDGSNYLLSAAFPAITLDLSQKFSIFAWVYEPPSDSNYNVSNIASVPVNASYIEFFGDNTTTTFHSVGTAGADHQFAIARPTGHWTLTGLVADGTGALYGYAYGPSTSERSHKVVAVDASTITVDQWKLGQSNNADKQLSGSLSQFFYMADYALSAAQVSQLADGGLTPDSITTPTNWYKLADDMDLADYGTAGYDLTVQGSAVGSSPDPDAVSGTPFTGQAIEFRGVDGNYWQTHSAVEALGPDFDATYGFWVLQDVLPPSGTFTAVFGPPEGETPKFYLYTEDDGSWLFYFGDPVTKISLPAYGADAMWRLIVVVCDRAADTMTVYDALQNQSAVQRGQYSNVGTASGTVFAPSVKWVLGNGNYTTNKGFHGGLSQFFITHEAFSAADITNLAAGSPVDAVTKPTHWWRLGNNNDFVDHGSQPIALDNIVGSSARPVTSRDGPAVLTAGTPEYATAASNAAHPELWTDAALFPLFTDNIDAHVLGTTVTPSVTSFAPQTTNIGQGYGQSAVGSTAQILYNTTALQRTGVSDFTFVAWVSPDHDSSPTASGTSQAIASGQDGSTTGDSFRSFLPVTYSGGEAQSRWRLEQAAGNVDLIPAAAWNAGDVLQFVGRLGAGAQDFSLYNHTQNKSYRNSAASSASISFSSAMVSLGNLNYSGGGGNVSFAGAIVYAYAQFARWTDAQITDNRADPFNVFRRASSLTISARGGMTTGGQAEVILARSLAIDAAGGWATGGQATVTLDSGLAARGGLVTGGNAIVGNRLDIAARGGVQTGGRASLTLNSQISIAARGGVQTGGRASLAINSQIDIAARGGVQTGGRASANLSMSIAATAFLNFRGTASYDLPLAITARGGLTTGGRASLGFGVAYAGSGGLATSGSASLDSRTGVSGRGGLVWDGSIALAQRQALAARGDWTIGGAGVLGTPSGYQALGGLVMGGAATLDLQREIAARGGLKFAGQAAIESGSRIYAAGGIRFSGAWLDLEPFAAFTTDNQHARLEVGGEAARQFPVSPALSVDVRTFGTDADQKIQFNSGLTARAHHAQAALTVPNLFSVRTQTTTAARLPYDYTAPPETGNLHPPPGAAHRLRIDAAGHSRLSGQAVLELLDVYSARGGFETAGSVDLGVFLDLAARGGWTTDFFITRPPSFANHFAGRGGFVLAARADLGLEVAIAGRGGLNFDALGSAHVPQKLLYLSIDGIQVQPLIQLQGMKIQSLVEIEGLTIQPGD